MAKLNKIKVGEEIYDIGGGASVSVENEENLVINNNGTPGGGGESGGGCTTIYTPIHGENSDSSSSNLTNTTWKFNESTSTATYSAVQFNINFVSNGQTFTLLDKQSYRGYNPLYYNTTYVYSGDWADEAYRTIEITGGADVENPDLVSFLRSCAIQIVDLQGFTETKTSLKIYEDLKPEEYGGLEKESNSFYQVNGVGIYKGEKLIAVGDDSKQDKLISGTNIKTINNQNILGSGNLSIQPSLTLVDNRVALYFGNESTAIYYMNTNTIDYTIYENCYVMLQIGDGEGIYSQKFLGVLGKFVTGGPPWPINDLTTYLFFNTNTNKFGYINLSFGTGSTSSNTRIKLTYYEYDTETKNMTATKYGDYTALYLYFYKITNN